MSGGAPAKALRNPAVGNASIGSARIPAGSEGFVEIEVAERAPISAASTPASKPAFINFAALHPSPTSSSFFWRLFVVVVPYDIHAHWAALGPHWARIASFLRSRLLHRRRPRHHAGRRRHHHLAMLRRRKHPDLLHALRHRLPDELEAHARLEIRRALRRRTSRSVHRQLLAPSPWIFLNRNCSGT